MMRVRLGRWPEPHLHLLLEENRLIYAGVNRMR